MVTNKTEIQPLTMDNKCPWCMEPVSTSLEYSGYEGDFIRCRNCGVTCKEIAKVSCSVLDKLNRNMTTYLSKEHILSAMQGHYREGLIS
jgi:hypothetical protein